MRIRALNLHAHYACRHSGACCTAGWRIPVEPAAERRILNARLPIRDPFERDGALAVTRVNADGACVFFEPGADARPHLCAVHRTMGQGALPLACRQFPRVSLVDARGASVTLSHFCPTAASLLVDASEPPRIVEDAPAFPADGEYDGLDARETLPPLLAPGMLMDLDGYDAWEDHAIDVLGRAATAEAGLNALSEDVERLRTWRPGRGPTLREAVRSLESVRTSAAVPPPGPTYGDGLFDVARSAVPSGLEWPAPPSALHEVYRTLVSPAWPTFARVSCAYLAARAFASWIAYQGRGLRTVLASLFVALDVLRVEAARACAAAQRPLDRVLLIEALRQADLLLVHRVASQRLADGLGAIER